MTVVYSTPFQPKPDAGFRLEDARTVWDAIVNANGTSQAAGLVAAGTTRATALPLTSVLNEIDTATSGTGVNLPLSTGLRSTPFSFCLVINNGASNIKVYGAQTGADTINGVAAATGVTQLAGTNVLYVSAKAGAWFALTSAFNSIPAGSTGTFTANGASAVTVANANVTANSNIVVTLKTVGGTVSPSVPYITTITPGTGFTITGTASDTSFYNYLIIG